MSGIFVTISNKRYFVSYLHWKAKVALTRSNCSALNSKRFQGEASTHHSLLNNGLELFARCRRITLCFLLCLTEKWFSFYSLPLTLRERKDVENIPGGRRVSKLSFIFKVTRLWSWNYLWMSSQTQLRV